MSAVHGDPISATCLHPLLLPAVLYIPGKTKIARGTHVPYSFLTNTAHVYRLNLSDDHNVFVYSNGKRFVCKVTSSRGWLLLEDLTTSKVTSHFFLFNPLTSIYMSKFAMSMSPRDPHGVIVVQSGADYQFSYCHVGDARWRPICGTTDQRNYD